MRDEVRYQFLQQKKRISLLLLSMLVIGFFFFKAIISSPAITTGENQHCLLPHSGTKDNSWFDCHSLRKNQWSDNDDGHNNEDDDEVYDEDDRENEYEREDA